MAAFPFETVCRSLAAGLSPRLVLRADVSLGLGGALADRIASPAAGKQRCPLLDEQDVTQRPIWWTAQQCLPSGGDGGAV